MITSGVARSGSPKFSRIIFLPWLSSLSAFSLISYSKVQQASLVFFFQLLNAAAHINYLAINLLNLVWVEGKIWRFSSDVRVDFVLPGGVCYGSIVLFLEQSN